MFGGLRLGRTLIYIDLLLYVFLKVCFISDPGQSGVYPAKSRTAGIVSRRGSRCEAFGILAVSGGVCYGPYLFEAKSTFSSDLYPLVYP